MDGLECDHLAHALQDHGIDHCDVEEPRYSVHCPGWMFCLEVARTVMQMSCALPWQDDLLRSRGAGAFRDCCNVL